MGDAPDQATATARDVVKRFPGAETPALAGVSMEVEPGRITGLVGPDGAGKTTLIRLLAGLMAADEGEVAILGRPAGEMLDQLGYMPQRFGLYEDLTVRQNLQLYAELRALPKEEHDATFDRLLSFTDLARFQDRLAGNLSGGMKQKLGLACTLVRTPKLMLLDEPGVGVDPISRRELWAMVEDLTQQGIAILWSTAYLDEAEKCDTVYLLNDGKLLFHGPPGELTGRISDRVIQVSGFEQRRRHFLTRMLDRDDIIDGSIQGHSVRLLVRDNCEIPDASALGGGSRTAVTGTAPRFEDGFIEILGGGPGGSSRLAEHFRTIPDSGRPAIEAKGLTKRFGDFTAARDMQFEIPQGHIYGLLGPNGAGKSTTFKMLCGLLSPTEGTGSVAGNDLRISAAEARSSLGYMAQKFSLYDELSVAQNLDFFAGAYNLARGEARQAKDAMVEIFDLGDKLDQNAGALPLGFKQRLALACAVMHGPPVLFLDEPTSGVDPVTRREFWTHINGLVEKGVTVLVTTHFMDEAEYCDDVSLIYRGEQIARGTPDGLKEEAAKLAGLEDPSMEDAFIALIEESDRKREAAEGEAA
ncbi:ABC-2 type transport system ATP-binding protein [Altererythrobacter atlanticus]|uniref:ABC transporter ATP-binding protein YbhF n=1 Tax=Croceibacterium atlanticum TaxID=1267766 RepID=A0A0F7KY73_9SPHN|nr:ATP-binding cassette domain-containing protein [Croceibacterium atlanticum]AKH44196.1 putative ABC transporter ATP-binding protein YbhF [Croceibacterium atlanticum]MBB5732507.1 ABC-2 type transport system ATP-binding protein [Croceibacterium atlanticum]